MPLDLRRLGIYGSGFKCFDDRQGIDTVLPLNIVVGRNNSGKSSLLDLLQHAIAPGSVPIVDHFDKRHATFVSYIIDLPFLDEAFRDTGSGGDMATCVRYAQEHLIDKRICARLLEDSKETEVQPVDDIAPGFAHQATLMRQFARALGKPLAGYSFKRLFADRDVVPEPDESSLEIMPNGSRATNVVQRFLMQDDLPSRLIETELLNDLNEVFQPDAVFTRILVQRRSNASLFEIHLEEQGKGRIPLSHTGSGIKTVLLTLLHFFVWPYLANAKLSQFMFGFEELEHNLHPAVQRRLFRYLRNRAVTECYLVNGKAA